MLIGGDPKKGGDQPVMWNRNRNLESESQESRNFGGIGIGITKNFGGGIGITKILRSESRKSEIGITNSKVWKIMIQATEMLLKAPSVPFIPF